MGGRSGASDDHDCPCPCLPSCHQRQEQHLHLELRRLEDLPIHRCLFLLCLPCQGLRGENLIHRYHRRRRRHCCCQVLKEESLKVVSYCNRNGSSRETYPRSCLFTFAGE